MCSKGNLWYVRHYEDYFDQVNVLYLLGDNPAEIAQGKSRLISLGSKYRFLDLLFAPLNLYRHARKTNGPFFLSADMVFGAWASLLVRRFLGARLVIMPVCILPELYSYSRKSLSGLPIWLEKILVAWTFRSAEKIIMGRDSLASLSWLKDDLNAAPKLQQVECTVEEFPPQTFYDSLMRNKQMQRSAGALTLLYVGRIHPEKMVSSLVDMMVILKKKQANVRLIMAGDGVEKADLEKKATKHGLKEMIEWLGYVGPDQLPLVYRRADIFVSTNTGTALREAGLAGLPIVAFKVDWVRQLLLHGENAMLCEGGDSVGLAENVLLLMRDSKLKERIAKSFHELARKRWATEKIKLGLGQTFDGLAES